MTARYIQAAHMNGFQKSKSTKLSDAGSTASAENGPHEAYALISSLFSDESQERSEQHAFAAGLIAGLSENVEKFPKVSELITYIHCLLDDDSYPSLSDLQISFDKPPPQSIRDAIRQGHDQAQGIIDLLSRHGSET